MLKNTKIRVSTNSRFSFIRKKPINWIWLLSVWWAYASLCLVHDRVRAIAFYLLFSWIYSFALNVIRSRKVRIKYPEMKVLTTTLTLLLFLLLCFFHFLPFFFLVTINLSVYRYYEQYEPVYNLCSFSFIYYYFLFNLLNVCIHIERKICNLNRSVIQFVY